MRHDGVDVKLDVWDLKEGQDKYAFMEQCVTNLNIDKVLIMSDKAYMEKADRRSGGVGDETAIISSQVYGNADQNKFIPIVMERDEKGKAYLPAYLESRIYRDLSGDNYEEEYEALLRIIFDEPSHRKPEIGERPIWLSKDRPDRLYRLKVAAKKINVADYGKIKKIAAREFIDVYIDSMKQFYVKNIDNDIYLKNFEVMKEYRDIFLDHLNAISTSEHFGSTMADEFELLYNTLYNVRTFVPNADSYGGNDLDLFRLHVWELFICTVTYMLHFEMYEDIHELLVHTYYLRVYETGNEIRPFCYEWLRFHSDMLEKYIKPTIKELSGKYTLTGHYICTKREYMPIYNAKAIANADLFLYQVYNGLSLDGLTQFGPWFPALYVYADGNALMWKRLTSKSYCKKIMPVFGVNTIEELKDRIAKCKPDRDYHYSGGWGGIATAILTWIRLDEIATFP